MSLLSELYKNGVPSMGLQFPNISSGPGNLSSMFAPATRTLPNGGGTYTSPVTAQQTAPPPAKPPVKIIPDTKIVSHAPDNQVVDVNPALINPATGGFYTPQELAMKAGAPQKKAGSAGAVPQYADDAITNPNQTEKQLNRSAYGLNNAANDISTGHTDPYKVASQSGITYSPSEMKAIEKAYAGIYDPALSDVFTKLDEKKKADELAATRKAKFEEMAIEHQYRLSEKLATTGGGATTYTPGADPVADSYVYNVQNGTLKQVNVPKAYQNAVSLGLKSYGNQANGRPTTTELGLQTLGTARELLTMFDARKGTSMVGGTRMFGGGFAAPGTDSADFEVLYENLVANKNLEGSKFLKGQGAVSDAERLLLAQAMNKLRLGQSEEEFRKQLIMVIDKLEGNQPTDAVTGAETKGTGFTVTDPNGGVHSFPDQASADAFKKAAGIQ